MNTRCLQGFMVFCALLVATGAQAKGSSAEEKAMREKMGMMERMEMMEKMEMADHLDTARSCAASNNFNCANAQLNQAQGLASDRADQSSIANTQNAVANQRYRYEQEQQRIAAEQRRIAAAQAAEQTRQQNFTASLNAANECLNVGKLECTGEQLNKAKELANSDSERNKVASLKNKAVEVANALAQQRNSDRYASGYRSGSSSDSSSDASYNRAIANQRNQERQQAAYQRDSAYQSQQRIQNSINDSFRSVIRNTR